MIDFRFFKQNQYLLWKTVPKLTCQLHDLSEEIKLHEQQHKIFDAKVGAALMNLMFAKRSFPDALDDIRDYFRFKIETARMWVDLVSDYGEWSELEPAKKICYEHLMQDYEKALIELEKRQQKLIAHLWSTAPAALSYHQLSRLKSRLESVQQNLIDAKKLCQTSYQHGLNQIEFYWQTHMQFCLVFSVLSFVMLYAYIGVQTSGLLCMLSLANFAAIASLYKLYQTHLSQQQLNQAFNALP